MLNGHEYVACQALREKIISPLLAANNPSQPPSQPANPTPLDHHYESLRSGMHHLLTELGVAA